MPEGSFEPTVIFFGLTNSLATFQVMMNNLLRDLVVEEKIAVFIDDVMVVTETKKGHDEIVEEVLRRLEENDEVCDTYQLTLLYSLSPPLSPIYYFLL